MRRSWLPECLGRQAVGKINMDNVGWAVSGRAEQLLLQPKHVGRNWGRVPWVDWDTGCLWLLEGSGRQQTPAEPGQPKPARRIHAGLSDLCQSRIPPNTCCPKAEEPPLSSLELGAGDVPRRDEKRCESSDGKAGQEQRTYVSGSGFGPICSASGHTSWSPVSGPGSL